MYIYIHIGHSPVRNHGMILQFVTQNHVDSSPRRLVVLSRVEGFHFTGELCAIHQDGRSGWRNSSTCGDT